jgi:hypothetical protein
MLGDPAFSQPRGKKIMKRILLTSTALVAFAGAAAAGGHSNVSWSGSATLGFNDDIKDGVYADVDLDVTMSAELDNGVTASGTFGWELTDDRNNDSANDYAADNNVLLSLTSDIGGLYYGDTEFAAVTYWSGVKDMDHDSFSEQDGENVLRGEIKLDNITAGISYGVDNEGAAGNGELNQLSVGVKATVGDFTFTAGYQEEDDSYEDAQGDYVSDEVLGLSVSTSLAGADITFAYASQGDEDSTGLQVAYPIGPVTATVWYVAESDTDDTVGVQVEYADGPLTIKAFYTDDTSDTDGDNSGIHVGYDVGSGLNVYAGWEDDDGQYIGAEYDLGGGATLVASFGDDEDNADNDEIGPQEYLHGTTVKVSFSF